MSAISSLKMTNREELSIHFSKVYERNVKYREYIGDILFFIISARINKEKERERERNRERQIQKLVI